MTENLTTKEVLTELRRLEKRVESGGHYGFEQSIWTHAADEIDRLTARLSEYMEELNSARLTCEYWKAEHIAGNEVVCRLTAEVAELRRDNANLRTTMVAAAEEISEHWQAHCDAEGYGPSNLMHRLEAGIPADYGYTAGAFAKLTAALKATPCLCVVYTVVGDQKKVMEHCARCAALGEQP